MSFRRQSRFTSASLLLPPALFSLPFLCAIFFPSAVAAQATPAAPNTSPPSGSPAAPEVATSDTPTTFHIRVNEVQVRVVVREPGGKVVDNLTKNDFQLFDNNKLQAISTFALERAPTQPAATTPGASTGVTNAAPTEAVVPVRFVALMFDDTHLKTEDALVVRNAANKVIDTITPADRVALRTTSGAVEQDFTNDLALLRNTLLRIIPRPMTGNLLINECPSISYFQAERMLNFHDADATNAAIADAWGCEYHHDPNMYAQAAQLADSRARQVLAEGEADIDSWIRRIEDVVRMLAGMPGQRIMALISPGVVSAEVSRSMQELIDRAVKAGVVVDTIDARGLYTPDMGDISAPDAGEQSGAHTRFHLLEQSLSGQILGDLAAGTGGTWFHNRNDLDAHLQQIIAAPPVSYVLSFSPQNLKPDGRYHTIKVQIAAGKDLVVQARRGYFAPKKALDPAEQAQAEIEQVLISQDELNEIAVELKTQFFMKDSADASLSVLAHFDLKSIHFRKTDGRNDNDLTVATVIFDENGHYIAANEKTLRIRMHDTTLEKLSKTGVTIKSTFDLKPGTYLVRLVARDSEGGQMAARNATTFIPNGELAGGSNSQK